MSRYRVFATCNIGDEALQKLMARGYDVEVYDRVEPPPKALIVEKVQSGVDALITTLRDTIDEEVLSAGAGTLKVIAQDAVGFDNIDREAANRYSIPFTHTPGVLTDATAEFALFMMGAVARKLHASEVLVRNREWKTWHPYEPFLGDEVTGKVVGVIGTGRIGRAFILRCTGLGVDLRCFDRMPDETFRTNIQVLLDTQHRLGFTKDRKTIEYASFEEVLREADFVSLHVPLNGDTFHLIDDAALQQMKKSAYLINTARGPIVDEDALYRALKEGLIAGAALDVYEQEPLPDNSPLRDPDLIGRLRLFHHFASAARKTRLSPDPDSGMAGRCVQGVLDVLEGNYGGRPSRMPFVVNKEAFGGHE